MSRQASEPVYPKGIYLFAVFTTQRGPTAPTGISHRHAWERVWYHSAPSLLTRALHGVHDRQLEERIVRGQNKNQARTTNWNNPANIIGLFF